MKFETLSFLAVCLISLVYFRVNAEVSGQIYPFYQSGVFKNLNTAGLGAQVQWQSKYSDSLRTQLEIKAEKDFEKTNESYFELTNGYFEFGVDTFKLKLGWQTIEWEGTDILNLADVVNSKNYARPLNPIPRASPSLRLTHEVGAWELDLLFIPKKVGHLYPNKKSYWLPRSRKIIIDSEKTEVSIPDSVEYELKNSEVLDSADSNNGGARISYRGPSFDMNIFGFEGSNVSGTLALEGVPTEIGTQTKIELTSPVIVRPLEYRQRVVGGTITKPLFETWIFRFSTSSTNPVGADPRLPKPQSAFVSSLEKSMEFFRKSLIVSVAYFEVKKNEINQLALLRSIFEKAYSISGRFEFSDDSTWQGAIVHDSVGKSQLVHLEWEYRLSGQLSFGLLGDQFSGSSDTLLGSYDQFDFYRTQLKWSF